MTEKTPQDEMRDKMSKMARERAGRLVNPTVSELIQARKQKLEADGNMHKGRGARSRRDRTAAMRNIISGDEGKGNRTRRLKRKEQLKKLGKPAKPKIIYRSK